MSFVRISCDAKLFDKVPRRLYKVQGCCVVCRNKTHEGVGERVPTDLRGKLTESPLRKSKNLAKRRRTVLDAPFSKLNFVSNVCECFANFLPEASQIDYSAKMLLNVC